VLLLAVAALIMFHPWGTDGGGAESAHATLAAADQGITNAGRRAQAREVRGALRKLESDPEELVAKASRDAVAGRARRAVPKGSKVTPIQRTWAPDGAGGGTMTVRVAAPGKRPVTYATVMVREPDGWKVLATIPVKTR